MVVLAPALSALLAAFAANLPEQLKTKQDIERLQALSAANEPLVRLVDIAKAVINEQGFVQIRGFDSKTARKIFPAIGSLVGKLFIDPAESSAIIGAHVRPSEPLMGNQLRFLPLHTDYSMLLEPPRLTMSQCVEVDPIPGWGALEVTDVEAMCFGVETHSEVRKFFSVKLPFAGRNARNGVDVIESPIISANSQRFVVRYHRSRIRQGFCAMGTKPTEEQAETMLTFERRIAIEAQRLVPEVGDITILDNHRTVHSRTRCSVSIAVDGSTTGRQMRFLFAY